ncbi:MAG: sugar nucleotide-binding protein, partial [Spirochaetales bacterium]|nr:sugar nucleotide-binding protein [Spirochaetales bacterium]
MFYDHWKILITGVTSIHGWPIYRKLRSLLPEERLCAIRSPKMKIPKGKQVLPLCVTDRKALENIKITFQPTHVIHGAGVCDLDVCEERPQWAHLLNVTGTKSIVDVFSGSSYIMYLSTDLVFSGHRPPEDGYAEHHAPDPVSVAGKTFARAEETVKTCDTFSIIRIALPLGDSLTGDKGGIDWTESRFKKNLPVTLFYDEIRSCIPCEKIAEVIPELLRKEVQGIYHLGENP